MGYAQKSPALPGDDNALTTLCLDEPASQPEWGHRLFERYGVHSHGAADWQLDLEMQWHDLDVEVPFDDDDFNDQ